MKKEKASFKTINIENKQTKIQETVRVRVPQGNEVLGIVEQRLGAGRMYVRCFDGKTRICRIPGALKRFLWVRENDIVLVKPWELEGEKKGDIIYKYSKTQVNALKKLGYLNKIDDFSGF